MVARDPRAPEAPLLHSIFRGPVHRAIVKDRRLQLAVPINVRVGVGAGLLPPAGARVFGGRSHVPIQSQ